MPRGGIRSQILRVDSEVCDALPAEIEDTLVLRIAEQITQFSMVIVSDYDKGVCTPRLLRSLIDAARQAGVPVIVDPIRGGDWSIYRGATMITPNRVEAELAIGRKIKSTDDAIDAGSNSVRIQARTSASSRSTATAWRSSPPMGAAKSIRLARGRCTTSPAPAIW